MRILHTSDWHLGKYLDRFSRIDEQKQFLEELEKIVESEKVDLIIVAGDIYDTLNPPIDAERLFFSSMKKLSNNGKRPIVIISGNHDSGSRISSSKPIATEFGIILQGGPLSKAEKGNYGNFSILDSGEGYFEIELNSENAVFITMPFPTEKNLNQIIYDSDRESSDSYSEKIGEIFKKLSCKFREDTINIVVGHFFVMGGEESDSERKIQSLGGSLAVSSSVFPKNSDYVAMGHLHKPQKVPGKIKNAYYSGSPIQYSKSEIGYRKSVYIADINTKHEVDVKRVYLKNYKPIEVLKCNSYEDACIKCSDLKDINCFVFIDIITDSPLLGSQIRALKELKDDIVYINIISDVEFKNDEFEHMEKSFEEEFRDFYMSKNKVQPSEEIVDLFLRISEEDDEGEI